MSPDGADGGSRPPKVEIDVDPANMHETLAAVTRSAAERGTRIYQRGGSLVRVVQPPARPKKAPALNITTKHIERWPRSVLACELTSFTTFNVERQVKKSTIYVPDKPPEWLVSAFWESREWPGIRPLAGITEVPVIDSDGDILMTPGYSQDTGLLFEPRVTPHPVPENPTHDDAKAALATLLDLVVDFPFETEAHKAVWLAYPATIAARFSFDGPTPMFWFDAPTIGTGKTFLEWIGAYIALGAESWKGQWPVDDDAEQRKLITTLALKAPRAICFDNFKRGATVGGPALEQVLTSTKWSGRILGVSADYDGPWTAVMANTGNNLNVTEDMTRRSLPSRLVSELERPAERDHSKFKYPNLKRHVQENQPQLLAALLTILRAYVVAGRPHVDLLDMDYKEWSKHVRAPLVWAGCADPAEAQRKAQSTASSEDLASARVLAGLQRVAGVAVGATEWTATRMLTAIYERDDGRHRLNTPEYDDLRAAIDELRPEHAHGDPNARAFGKVLSGLRDRTLGGLRLCSRLLHGATVYTVERVG